jgi:hypothetical protein
LVCVRDAVLPDGLSSYVVANQALHPVASLWRGPGIYNSVYSASRRRNLAKCQRRYTALIRGSRLFISTPAAPTALRAFTGHSKPKVKQPAGGGWRIVQRTALLGVSRWIMVWLLLPIIVQTQNHR